MLKILPLHRKYGGRGLKNPCFCFVGDGMKAQEYLQQIEKYDLLIENRKFEIMELQSSASLQAGFSSDTKVQTTRRLDRAENVIIGYIEREAGLQEDIAAFWKLRQEIIRTIELLNTNEYGVLYCLYVNRKGMQEVADQFDRSYRWAVDMKRKALDNLQKILDEREKTDERF